MAAVVPPPKAKAFPVSPHPAKYILFWFIPIVVAHAVPDHFSMVSIGTAAPVPPPKLKASDVFPHTACEYLTALEAVVVAYAVPDYISVFDIGAVV